MRRYVNIELEEETIKDCDTIADKNLRSRKQIIEFLITKTVETMMKNKELKIEIEN